MSEEMSKSKPKENNKSNDKASPTAYDDSFRTLLNDCKELIIPVVNLSFGENYTGKEEVMFHVNEHLLSQESDNVHKVITDSCFTIVGLDGKKKKYHIECEAVADDGILLRIMEYDTRIALDGIEPKDNVLTVTFPHSAVIFLRHTKETPDKMLIRIITPEGETKYHVPVIKIQEYSIEEIFDKKLLFFIPFYIFGYENRLEEFENDNTKLEMLEDEYRRIRIRLDDLQKVGEINEFVKKAICAMTNHVIAKLAEKYQKVREGVEKIMGGRILEYEAKTIRDEALNKGREEGRYEERKMAQAETEARARDMLRDRMELSLVEKYTHLSMPRIQELARGLGML